MFRIKLSNFKQVVAVALIPRLFVRDTKQIKNKLNNYTIDVFSIAKKSTDSGSKDDEIEKQRQIIKKCFEETSQDSKDLKDDSSEMEKQHTNIVPPDFDQLSDAEKCNLSKASDDEPSHETSGMQAEEASVRATTAKIVEETLDQKVETIDETPDVEASPLKIEGFNSTPKVLGHDIEFFAEEKIQQIDLDDLAKRCVGAPIGNIDELLIKEMKNMANNDIKPPSDMNLIKSHGVEKYYSEIFEHFSQLNKSLKVENTPIEPEPSHLLYENKSIGDKEIKSERITPLHIDSVHLFAVDEGSKDYKETGLFRDNSVNLFSNVEEPLLDLPSIITPYESAALPFYEYVYKEQIILDAFDETETVTIAKTAEDSSLVADTLEAKHVFLKNEDTDKTGPVIKKHKMNPVEPEPTLSHTAEPILKSKLKEYNIPNAFGNLSQEQLLKLLYLHNNSNIDTTAKSHVFTTSTKIPSSGDQINPAQNSAISGTISTEVPSKEGSQNIEMPENSAISANQNPGEYFDISYLNEPLNSNFREKLQTLTAENHLIHAFCTQLQQTDDGVSKETDDLIKILDYPVLVRDPFSYLILNQETGKNAGTEALSSTASSKNVVGTDGSIPLSQIMKKIRAKNRLEFCRSLLLENAKQKTSQPFTCVTPLDRSKPKTTLTPNPCQPAPKPPKVDKSPKQSPPQCPPKKDPCAKMVPFFLNTLLRSDVSFDIPAPMKQYNGICTYKSIVTDDIIERLRKLGEWLHFMNLNVDRDTNYINDTICAREFEPWTPIPSWPEPKVGKKRPFVCPKEGCKPVPRSNPPKQRPCLGIPKKSFSFSKFNLTPVNPPDIIFINL